MWRQRFWFILAVVLFGVGLWGSIAQAQPVEPITVTVHSSDVSQFPEVGLQLMVRDGNGVPISGLQAEHFEVWETGDDTPRPLSTVTSRLNPEADIAVLLLLDISGSMSGQPLTDAQAAIADFMVALGANDQVSLFAFATSVDLEAFQTGQELPFTRDKNALLSMVQGLEAGGGTALYDALYKGILLTAQADRGYRAIVLLTDGVDEDQMGQVPGSLVATRDTPIQEAQRAGIPIFTIGLGPNTDAGYLELLARTTGGRYQVASDSGELGELYTAVAEELRQEYKLTYQSGLACEGVSRRVRVRVTIDGRLGETEATIGPLPNDPMCNPSPLGANPASDSQPTESVPPAPSTIATSSPSPSPVPTLVVINPPPLSEPIYEQPEPSSLGGTSFWLPTGIGFLLFVIIVTVWVLRRRPAIRRDCHNCGYPLTAGEHICPQCGSTKATPTLRK